jgi:hypothetical protein
MESYVPRLSRRAGFLGISLVVLVVVAIGGTWAVPREGVAQNETCSGVLEIVNGGFESPAVGGTAELQPPTGWTGAGFVSIHPPGTTFASGTQFVLLGYQGLYGSISQELPAGDLEGEGVGVHFFVTSSGSGTVAFNRIVQSISTPGEGAWEFFGPLDPSLPMTLSLSGTGTFYVDSITATYEKPCPTPTESPTPSPTMTPIPSATETPQPTATETPQPTATSEPGSIADQQMTITGDPRFPIQGSAAIPGEPGLTYALGTSPVLGTAIVAPDGSFTYTAVSSLASSDQFTVIATALGGETAIITVTVIYEVDKSIPTYGEVEPGGTGNGGPVEDARNPSNPSEPEPSAVPDQEDEDDSDENDEDSCERCD